MQAAFDLFLNIFACNYTVDMFIKYMFVTKVATIPSSMKEFIFNAFLQYQRCII